MAATSTVATLIALMMSVTLVGRRLAEFLPYRLRPLAKLYLSPALGLALLVLVSSHHGRFLGFAVIPTGVAVLMTAMALLALFGERNKRRALCHVIAVAIVSLIAGSSLLMPVFRFGGYDSFNDAFTYLVHGNWLQHHGFLERIAEDVVRPETTQMAIYQHFGFRMGGSYVLGWVQAMAGMEWSYFAYPVVLAAAATGFCFAAVFAASCIKSVRPLQGYLLACLPALTLGGLVFGMIKGFLAQVFGMMFALAFMVVVGALLAELTTKQRTTSTSVPWRSGLIAGGLLAAAVSSYSELSPIIILAVAIALIIILSLKPNRYLEVLKVGSISAFVATILLNWEAWRAIQALLHQSQAVVGWKVDFSLLQFTAHAFGLHGGSGDQIGWLFQSPYLGIACLATILAAIALAFRGIKRDEVLLLLPVICFAAVCAVAFFYFRYFSLADEGSVQRASWSQFKLANWVFVATAAIMLVAIVRLATPWRNVLATSALGVAVLVGLFHNYFAAWPRTAHVIAQLNFKSTIFNSLLEIRSLVKQHVRPDEVVYLDIQDDLGKLRQLLTYVLPDVRIAANWLDDGYIFHHLPLLSRNPPLSAAQYLISATAGLPPHVQAKNLWHAGPLTMIPIVYARYVKIMSATGGYGRESEGARWWHWVNDRIEFTLQDIGEPPSATLRKLSFEYWQSPDRDLTLEVVAKHDRLKILLPRPPDQKGFYDMQMPTTFGPIEKIIVSASGDPRPLSDNRMVKFLIANVNVELLTTDVRKD